MVTITLEFAVRPAPRIGGGKSVRRYLPQWYQDQREYLTVVFMAAAHDCPGPPVFVNILLGYKGWGRGDADNVEKPIFDAMKRAGLVPDDRWRYIRGHSTEAKLRQPHEWTRITISPYKEA